MTTLFNAPSVDPTKVTPADIAAILAEHDINTTEPAPADFFQPGVAYYRRDEFRCLAVGWIDLVPVALGLLPVNLGGVATWEFGYLTRWDWQRGWTEDEALMCRSWKPGRGYHTAIRNLSRWRNNGDGTITAVAVVWSKTLPAFDGGEWTENELWTVRLPLDPDDPLRAPAWMSDWIGRSRLMPRRYRNGWLQPGPVYMLCDKPHRVTWWAEDDPRREVLDRGPVPAKLAARIAADDERMRRSLRRINYYTGPVRVSRSVYDTWRVAFRVRS